MKSQPEFLVPMTIDLMMGYTGILTSQMDPTRRGIVLRTYRHCKSADIVWIGRRSHRGDKIQLSVPTKTLALDSSDTVAADHISRKISRAISFRHGRIGESLHELDPFGCARVICVRHQYGGTAVRLDLFCRGCRKGDGPGYTYVHQDALLHNVPNREMCEEEINRLRLLNTRCDDGSRRVDRRGLAILARYIFRCQSKQIKLMSQKEGNTAS